MWESVAKWYDSRMYHARACQVTVGDRGRIVLPAAVRKALGLSTGSRMLLSTEADGSLRLRPYRAVADHSRGLLADLASADVCLVDELLAERRREVARDTDGS